MAFPPQIAPWAWTSPKQARAGITVQLRVRAGYGGLDRGMMTGGKGHDHPYVRSRWDRETAAPGQGSLLDTGYCQRATYDAMREHGSERVTIRHESIPVEVSAARAGETPVTAPG